MHIWPPLSLDYSAGEKCLMHEVSLGLSWLKGQGNEIVWNTVQNVFLTHTNTLDLSFYSFEAPYVAFIYEGLYSQGVI